MGEEQTEKPFSESEGSENMASTATDNTEALAELGLVEADGSVNLAALQDLLASQGLKAVAEGVKEGRYIRKVQAERWESATAEDMTEEEKTTLKRVLDVLGVAPTAKDATAITQADIDLLVEEASSVKNATDMYEGRVKAIKRAVINFLLNKQAEGDGTGYVASPKFGKKIVIQNMDKTPNTDYNALAEVLDPEVWESITDEVVTREVSPEKLEKALGNGSVTLEQLAAIQPEPRIFKTMVVRDLKPGDEVI